MEEREGVRRETMGWFPAITKKAKLDQQVTSTHGMWYWNLAMPIKGGVSGLTEDVISKKIAGLAKDCKFDVYCFFTRASATSSMQMRL